MLKMYVPLFMILINMFTTSKRTATKYIAIKLCILQLRKITSLSSSALLPDTTHSTDVQSN